MCDLDLTFDLVWAISLNSKVQEVDNCYGHWLEGVGK